MSDDGFGGLLQILGGSEQIPFGFSANGTTVDDGFPVVRATFDIHELQAEVSLTIEESRALREQLRQAETNAIAESGLDGFDEEGPDR
jgi:hypothetical protein